MIRARPASFHKYWTVITPPGWSCLFVPLLNRPNPLFQVFAGVVDTDTYRSLIHFPFVATAPDGVHTLEKGTPLVQCIPFRRETAAIEGEIGPETKDEAETRERIRRLTARAKGGTAPRRAPSADARDRGRRAVATGSRRRRRAPRRD